MNECIRRRIQLLREKHINRRKQHVLKSRKHLNYLHELQSKYVLVPADKAAKNIIYSSVQEVLLISGSQGA